jgi:hypothetical protein
MSEMPDISNRFHFETVETRRVRLQNRIRSAWRAWGIETAPEPGCAIFRFIRHG